MYWLVDVYKANNGDKFLTYNYFCVVPYCDYKRPWYNGITKQTIYPATHQLTVKAIIVESEEQFLDFYNKNKRL